MDKWNLQNICVLCFAKESFVAHTSDAASRLDGASAKPPRNVFGAAHADTLAGAVPNSAKTVAEAKG